MLILFSLSRNQDLKFLKLIESFVEHAHLVEGAQYRGESCSSALQNEEYTNQQEMLKNYFLAIREKVKKK